MPHSVSSFRSFDLWAIDDFAALVAEAREINEGLRAFAVLNAADAQGNDNQAAAETLGEAQGLEYLPALSAAAKHFPMPSQWVVQCWSKLRGSKVVGLTVRLSPDSAAQNQLRLL